MSVLVNFPINMAKINLIYLSIYTLSACKSSSCALEMSKTPSAKNLTTKKHYKLFSIIAHTEHASILAYIFTLVLLKLYIFIQIVTRIRMHLVFDPKGRERGFSGIELWWGWGEVTSFAIFTTPRVLLCLKLKLLM